MAYRRRKQEKKEKQKFEYLENEKKFLHETKSIFHNFFKGYHLLNQRKITGKSFNLGFNGFSLSRDLARKHDQTIMRLYGMDFLK